MLRPVEPAPRKRFLAIMLASLAVYAPGMARAAAVVLLPDRTVPVADGQVIDGDLWVPAEQLPQINGFELKAQGACCAAICVPINRKPDGGYIREANGKQLFNLSKLARGLEQPLVADVEKSVFSFGEIPLLRADVETTGIAPDFTLPDRTGKPVTLSEFRGKKVFLVTWASWCGCKLDLAGWQSLYAELKDKNFEVIAVAEDTEGEAAAGTWYDKAKATYTTLIDRDHVVSSLYHMVNVPTGVWIDEQGRIVRPPEVAYSRDVALMNIKVNGGDYVTGLRDWIENGEKSKYVVAPAGLKSSMGARPADLALADTHFKLGTYFHEHGEPQLAAKHWKEAQTLNPDSWNYHRQEWSYSPKDALGKWMAKVRTLGDKPYYAPLKLPTDGK